LYGIRGGGRREREDDTSLRHLDFMGPRIIPALERKERVLHILGLMEKGVPYRTWTGTRTLGNASIGAFGKSDFVRTGRFHLDAAVSSAWVLALEGG